MKYHIKSFSPFKTALHVSVFYFVMSFIFMAILGVFSVLSGGTTSNYVDGGLVASEFDTIAFVLHPFKSAIVGFIAIYIACFAYNKIAARLGGIELEFMETLPSNPYKASVSQEVNGSSDE